MELHRVLQLEPCTQELAERITGGYYARYGTETMIVSGLDGESEYAVNSVLLLKYLIDRGLLPKLPITFVPLANKRACNGVSLDDAGYLPYYDFLYLRGTSAKQVNELYHLTRPKLVIVIRGGRRFRVYATTSEAAKLFDVEQIRDSVHTLQGIAPLKYSHSVVIQVPHGEVLHAAYEAYRLASMAKRLEDLGRGVVKREVAEFDPDAIELLKLHGAKVEGNELIIDNLVYVFFLRS